jgi:hypothetical protein
MARESFRFIHASDFHLEKPFQDLLDLPDSHRSNLVRAPWKAAASVFEHACIDQVDFVLLTGDLLNPFSSGAAGPAFLIEQFEELQRHNIEVFWCGGVVDDPERWPDAVMLPENVHLFSKKQVEPVVYRRNGQPLATIIGRSSDGRESVQAVEYDVDEDSNFRIGMGYGLCDPESLAGQRIDYWALGGRHARDTVHNESPHIRYCGTTQARSLSETGSHGCDVVEVDSDRNIAVTQLDVDEFRYSSQTIDADDISLGRDLRQLMVKRINKLQSESPGKHWLIDWLIHMDLENSSVVGPAAIDELLQWLRREFGHSQPAAWSIDIDVIPPKKLPKKWQDEDTILGDFLRTAKEHRKTNGAEIKIKNMIDLETPGTSLWQTTLQSADPQQRAALIEHATLMGVDLLRGHKLDLVASTRRFGEIDSK